MIVDDYVTYCRDTEGLTEPSVAMVELLKKRIKNVGKWESTSINILRIHRIRESAEGVQHSPDPVGEGDKFLRWCIRKGRPTPSPEMVALMNENPSEGSIAIRKDATNPQLYRALVTYKSYGGLGNV